MSHRAILRAVLCGTAATLLASCLPVLAGEDYDLRGQEVRLTFLHTSDIHSRLLPYDFSPIKTDQDLGLIPDVGPFGGATRIASILKRERVRADRVVHVDSGDSFQGAPIFNLNTGEAEYRFLSLVGLNAAVIGNHEFDAGAVNFANRARDWATFPVLAANYIWEDANSVDSNKTNLYTAPYTITNARGVKVGIIGMANVSTLNSLVEGGNSLQATPFEQNEALRAYVDLLRPMVDMVIVTSHLGLTEDQDLINGYDAFFEFGKIKKFVDQAQLDQLGCGGQGRTASGWQVLEWFPADAACQDATVVRVWIPGISGVDVIFGGHLHVVLNPPQTLEDPSGRKTLLVHSGAFAKFVGRLDTVVSIPDDRDPATTPARLAEGAEIVSHDYRVFPIDGVWCDDAARTFYKANFWNPGQFRAHPTTQAAMAACTAQENPDTQQLLIPYVINLDYSLQLASIFAYSPRDIARRNSSSGGDAPLGNIAADSMRKRRRVEAEVGLTNTLGIRDNLYQGPLTQESMFNVFPFENTINIMYLSGVEMQEMLDFVASRSATRGCQSQAQVSGVRFTMDCAQSQLNDVRYPCNEAAECPVRLTEGHAPWECREDVAGKRCWAHTATDIAINGAPLDQYATYKVAVNDYIAKGGSGFSVLKRNTTRIETGIPLRESLIGYMQNFCSCKDILSGNLDDNGRIIDDAGNPCGSQINGTYVIEPQITSFCQSTQAFQDVLTKPVGTCTCAEVLKGNSGACGTIDAAMQSACALPNAGPFLGRCSCADVLQNNTAICGNITQQVRAFCDRPMEMSIAIASEDGRISRRLK